MNADLILILEAENRRADVAFEHEHNNARLQKPRPAADERYVREQTASTDGGNEEEETFSHPIIRLRFDQRPKDITQGWVFGSDPDLCDVLLGTPRTHISARHFCIKFDGSGRLVLESLSRQTMSVDYNGQCGKQPKCLFRWILFDGPVIMVLLDARSSRGNSGRPGLLFKVHLAKHHDSQAEYQQKLDAFLEESRTTDAALQLLELRSRETTAPSSQPDVSSQETLYYREHRIGRGEFGAVYKTLNVSTGQEYAGKLFFRGTRIWRREVDILRNLSHEHIVGFVDFTDEVERLLIMEYLPLGDLRNQRPDITPGEGVRVLHQGLMALDYLHSEGHAHRDIKPANILLESREPFKVKLADFGLAKDSSALETRCGTARYAAPEVYKYLRYSTAVDIWSLGLVAFEYVYGLPEHTGGEDWYKVVNRTVMDWDSDPLIDMLSDKMLRMEAAERLTAEGCLTALLGLQLTDFPPPTAGADSEVATVSIASAIYQLPRSRTATTPVAGQASSPATRVSDRAPRVQASAAASTAGSASGSIVAGNLPNTTGDGQLPPTRPTSGRPQ